MDPQKSRDSKYFFFAVSKVKKKFRFRKRNEISFKNKLKKYFPTNLPTYQSLLNLGHGVETFKILFLA